MKFKYMLKIIKYISLAALLLILGFVIFVEHDFIELRTNKAEHLQLVPIQQGERFCMRFIHSVALTPVDECFSPEGGNIVLKSTIYHDFGAGLPHAPEFGQTMSVKDGKIIIEGYSLRIPDLQIRVGRIAKHMLLLPHVFSDKVDEVYLAKFVKPGEVVSVKAKRLSILEAVTKYWSTLYIKL